MIEDASGLEDEDEGGVYQGFILAITDWKVWWFGFIMFLTTTSNSFSIYFPSDFFTLKISIECLRPSV